MSVRLEPIIFELERCQEDLLIIGHASVIRCLVSALCDVETFGLIGQLAYLVGLPPSEVPAVEIARGDLVEVTPASYGVMTRAYHFWSGEGRGNASGQNLYENFAESTLFQKDTMVFSGETQDMLQAAADEEVLDKQAEAGARERERLRRRVGSSDGTRSAPILEGVREGREDVEEFSEQAVRDAVAAHAQRHATAEAAAHEAKDDADRGRPISVLNLDTSVAL